MTSLFDRLKNVPPTRRGPRSWYDKLTDADRREIDEVYAAFKAGQVKTSGRALAAAIVKDFEARGIETCSAEAMRQWLMRS